MKFQVKSGSISREKTQCLIVPVFEGGKLSAAAAQADKSSKGAIKQVIKRKDIEGKRGQLFHLPLVSGLSAQRLLLMGCGKASAKLSPEAFRQLIEKLASFLHNQPVTEAIFCLDDIQVKDLDHQWQSQTIAQTLQLSDYNFDHFKSKKSKPRPPLKTFSLLIDDKKIHGAYRVGLKVGQAIAEGQKLSRDLANTPGNACTPSYLAQQARKLATQYSTISCKTLSEKQMATLGMGALLSVTAGTREPAKLIVMEYKGVQKNKTKSAPCVLVGKGITFDSGGISLKPGAAMDEMKYDMCGAASVFGTLRAIAQLKLPIDVVGIVAAAENMPSGDATKPGDIVTSMSGQTIEILNTDAEGRLVLCDALTYAERYKPKTVIDIATLTGACVVALGNHAHGLYSNDDKLAEQLLDAGVQTNDRGWQMPLWDDYDKQLKSPFADMANIGGPGGGSITAACFLARFTKKMRWAHLDIAGTAWKKMPKGATGRPVPLLVQYLVNESHSGNK